MLWEDGSVGTGNGKERQGQKQCIAVSGLLFQHPLSLSGKEWPEAGDTAELADGVELGH